MVPSSTDPFWSKTRRPVGQRIPSGIAAVSNSPFHQWVSAFLWRKFWIAANTKVPDLSEFLETWQKMIHSRELVQSKCLQNLTVRKMSGCGVSAATKREYLNTYTYGSIFLDPMNMETVQGTKMYQGPCGGWSISISVGRGTYLKGGKPRPTVWAMRLLSFSRTILRLSTGTGNPGI